MLARVLRVPEPEYDALVAAIQRILDAAEAQLVTREPPADPAADRATG